MPLLNSSPFEEVTILRFGGNKAAEDEAVEMWRGLWRTWREEAIPSRISQIWLSSSNSESRYYEYITSLERPCFSTENSYGNITKWLWRKWRIQKFKLSISKQERLLTVNIASKSLFPSKLQVFTKLVLASKQPAYKDFRSLEALKSRQPRRSQNSQDHFQYID